MIRQSALTRTCLVWLFLAIFTGCSKSPETVDFTLKTDEGQVPLSKYRGKVVYLDFWATWCAPCRESFPWMREMQEKYAEAGLQIVAVSLDTDHVLARQFAEELAANFLVGYDDSGAIADQFKVLAMPTSVIIDRKGSVVEVHQGFKADQTGDYEQALLKVLDGGR